MPVLYLIYIILSLRRNKKEQTYVDENLTLTDIYLPVVPNESLLNITRLLWFELWGPQNSCFKNLCYFPIKIIYILTLPYESNPLILFCSQYVVIFCGLNVFFFVFFLLLDVNLLYGPIVSISIVVVFMIMRCFKWYKNYETLFMNILCFGISCSFNYICSQLLKDLCLFLGFQLK